MTESQRVAIVTGAARGIGAATVRELARTDWSVLAVDLAEDDAAIPYALASKAELEAVMSEAANLAGDKSRVASFIADVRNAAALGGAPAAVIFGDGSELTGQ